MIDAQRTYGASSSQRGRPAQPAGVATRELQPPAPPAARHIPAAVAPPPPTLFGDGGGKSPTSDRGKLGNSPTDRRCDCGCVVSASAKFCGECGARSSQPAAAFHVVCVSPESKDLSSSLCSEGGEIVIGTGSECGLVLNQDDYVSRRHAKLETISGQLFLDDLGSTNGTYLRVRSSMLLTLGDEFIVGSTVFRVESGDKSENRVEG